MRHAAAPKNFVVSLGNFFKMKIIAPSQEEAA